MVYKNNRGQVLIELVFTLILFTSLLAALQKISSSYNQRNNKHKLSQQDR